jgi:hypothetical protein
MLGDAKIQLMSLFRNNRSFQRNNSQESCLKYPSLHVVRFLENRIMKDDILKIANVIKHHRNVKIDRLAKRTDNISIVSFSEHFFVFDIESVLYIWSPLLILLMILVSIRQIRSSEQHWRQ